jgi:hypothetical protein
MCFGAQVLEWCGVGCEHSPCTEFTDGIAATALQLMGRQRNLGYLDTAAATYGRCLTRARYCGRVVQQTFTFSFCQAGSSLDCTLDVETMPVCLEVVSLLLQVAEHCTACQARLAISSTGCCPAGKNLGCEGCGIFFCSSACDKRPICSD